MRSRRHRVRALVVLIACLAAIPAGYAIAKEVAPEADPDGAATGGVVKADECPSAVNDAFKSEGFSPDSYGPECPTASEAARVAEYHNQLRRYGLTRIAESIREHAGPSDQQAQAELETIEKELEQLGGPLNSRESTGGN
jgi:hypothetical protein